jgi:hypothetical protein
MKCPRALMLTVLLGCVLISTSAYAQATLAGTVRDTSGAVLPGVTVEASSPALIEKVRTAVTDGSGQYRITELAPGTYALTFSLSGFTSTKRDGVTVSGSGVIPINVELGVGTLAETVTVSGEAPLVDTQTTRRETVVSSETLNTLPITRSYGAVLYAVPGLQVAPGVGGNDLVPSMATFSAHGGNSTEGRMLVNGLSVAGPFSGNSVAQFGYDIANADELQVLVSGGLGEAETGGPLVNLIPKSGGNSFTGAAFYSGTSSKFQADNVDDQLRAANITEPPAIRSNWDGSGSVGGPIKRDRIWFYGSLRTFGLAQVVEGASPNLNAFDPTQWLYAPATGVEVRRAESKTDLSVRLTGQVTTRNRLSFSHQYQDRCLGSSMTPQGDGACRTATSSWVAMGTATGSPEATAGYGADPSTLTQATWTSTVSNRLLIDTAISRFTYGIVGNGQMPPDANLDLVGVTEQSAVYGRAGYSYRAPFTFNKYDTVPWGWRGAVSYVTGAHSAKIGYQGALQKYDWHTFVNSTQMRYVFNNQVPVGVNYFVAPSFDFSNRTETHAIYAQDQWTHGRVTLQGAVRYDRVTSWAPAEGNGTSQTSIFNPQPITFDRTVSVRGYNDINPRMGLAYDVFGNGRTAVKVNVGRYLSAATADGIYSANSPALKLITSLSGATGRGWTDSNRNYHVDCDLTNPAAQNLTASGGDVCAGLTGNNLNFGQINPTFTTIDPDILGGWGVRPYNWQLGASVQHELIPGISVDAGYNRRWWGNHFVTVNTLVGPDDFDTFSVPLPDNQNLPGAGSSASFVAIKPDAAQRGSQNFMTKETNYAPARTTYWHGFDYSANARLKDGVTLQGGASTGRGVRNTCDLWAARPDLQVVIPALSTTATTQRTDSCDVTEPWMTTFRGLASYRLPKVDVLVSSIFRSVRTTASGDVGSNGNSLSANYQLPNTVVQQYLGRLPAGALANGTTTLNILSPAALYPLERQNQMDLRFAKILRFGHSRYDLGVDLYNLFNANTGTAFQQTYVYTNQGSTWLNPTSIMSPRLLRFNVTATF